MKFKRHQILMEGPTELIICWFYLPDRDMNIPITSTIADTIRGVQLALLTVISAPNRLNDSESPAA